MYLFIITKETNEDESELKKDFNQLNFNTFPQMGETGENSTNEKDTKIENTNSSEKESNKERTDLCYWKGLHAGIRHRPESLLWYLISFLLAYVFYMPFFTLVSLILVHCTIVLIYLHKNPRLSYYTEFYFFFYNIVPTFFRFFLHFQNIENIYIFYYLNENSNVFIFSHFIQQKRLAIK